MSDKNNIYIGPRQANSVLIAYASSEGSGEPAHPRSLARTFAARSYKQWVKRNLQTESQIPGPSEWLGMRSYNLSWRNARRHKFAWRGSIDIVSCFAVYQLLPTYQTANWPYMDQKDLKCIFVKAAWQNRKTVVKEIKSRAWSASDLSLYDWPTNSELLLNNSGPRADLFRF